MARVSKINLWFKHFTNEACQTTFLNRKEAARAAGYKANSEAALRAIGSQNFTKLSTEIDKWLNEAGLSENALKIKLLGLLEAKETKFFQKDGVVTDERNVEALETQRRTLDMALKIKGIYAAEKLDVDFNASQKLIEALQAGRNRVGVKNGD